MRAKNNVIYPPLSSKNDQFTKYHHQEKKTIISSKRNYKI